MSSTAAQPALQVDRLVVRMGVQQILHEVSLQVPERGVVTVLGANGVGKTTLMRTISGIYHAAGGSVSFAGQTITNLPAHRIVALGLAQAPEGRQVFSNMSVRENLVLGGAMLPRAEFDATFEDVLQRFPLLRDRLVSRPRLLLLDEPSLGLAPKIVKQIFDLVASIRAGGTAILLVEQNVRAALKVADHGYVMEGGRVLLQGPAEQLRDDPRVRDAYLGGGH